ncbi:MAG: RNA polymerase sigma-70 factor (ECF subfamily) [Bradymonadia bacterium]
MILPQFPLASRGNCVHTLSISRASHIANQNKKMDKQQLLDGLQCKDILALDVFYERYKGHILAIARRIVTDEWDAEEVLQDVVWITYRKAEFLRENTNLKAWVSQVTRNAALMLLRKRKRVPMPIDAQVVEAANFGDLNSDAKVRPDAVTASRQALVQVERCLDDLDPLNRELFLAMDVEGRSKEEVAETLGLTTAAVKSRLHRARQAVRTLAAELA